MNRGAITQGRLVMNTIDKEIGRRIRHRRWRMSITQQELGKLIGVSFQQIQKYETGTNRVSASKLIFIANALSVPITYFFDNIETNGKLEDPSCGSMVTKTNLEVRTVAAVTERTHKRKDQELVP